jgi:hypothetical protein
VDELAVLDMIGTVTAKPRMAFDVLSLILDLVELAGVETATRVPSSPLPSFSAPGTRARSALA